MADGHPQPGNPLADSLERVVKRPGVCGGVACIRGTRIMVWLLVLFQRQGKSDPWILANYPQLGMEDLNAAQAYFRQNASEIEQQIWLNTVAANHPPDQQIPEWMLVQGRLLGLSEEDLCEAFEVPPSLEHLAAAWESYQKTPALIERQIAESNLVA